MQFEKIQKRKISAVPTFSPIFGAVGEKIAQEGSILRLDYAYQPSLEETVNIITYEKIKKNTCLQYYVNIIYNTLHDKRHEGTIKNGTCKHKRSG